MSQTIIRRSKDTLTAEADDQAVLLSVRNGQYYTLDTVGSVVWRLLANPITLAELTERLADCFDGDLDKIHSEAEEYLKELADHNLIVQSQSHCTR